MIYLIFDCVSANRDVTINEEFDNYAWVKADDLKTTISMPPPALRSARKGYFSPAYRVQPTRRYVAGYGGWLRYGRIRLLSGPFAQRLTGNLNPTVL